MYRGTTHIHREECCMPYRYVTLNYLRMNTFSLQKSFFQNSNSFLMYLIRPKTHNRTQLLKARSNKCLVSFLTPHALLTHHRVNFVVSAMCFPFASSFFLVMHHIYSNRKFCRLLYIFSQSFCISGN